MRPRYQLYGKNREVFLKGLQRYQDRGVTILVDGKEADASEWIKILEVQADGSFYMGDYIMDDSISPEKKEDDRPNGHILQTVRKGGADIQPAAMVREDADSYEAKEPCGEKGKVAEADIACTESCYTGVLKEIRFDRVYNR